MDKQIGVDLCSSPGHVCLSLRVSLSACFILADMHVCVCVFIHNAATTAAACSYAFIYILRVFGVFLKLSHSEEIHQAGAGKTQQRSRGQLRAWSTSQETMVAELLSPSCPISHLSQG